MKSRHFFRTAFTLTRSRHENDDILPLSLEQRAIWCGQEAFGESSPAYALAGSYRLCGPLDPELLRRAVILFATRHRMTRALLRRGTPFPWFEVTDQPNVTFELRDVPGLDQVAAEAVGAGWVIRPFALFDAPLLRCLLIRQAPERHIFILSVHHVMMDGWSLISAFNEIAAILGALTSGTDPDLPPAIDFAEILAEEEAYAASPRRSADETFWRDQLALRSPEPLFERRVEAAGGSDRTGHVSVPIPRPLFDQLLALGRQCGASPSATLLAGVTLLMARLCDRDHMLVGIPFLNRPDRRTRQLIGHRVKMLPLAVTIDPDQTFGALAESIGRSMRQAMRHGHYPVEELATSMGLRLSHGGLFDLSVNHVPLNTLPRLGQATVDPIKLYNGCEPLILDAEFLEYGPERVGLMLGHAVDYLAAETAAVLGDRLLTLLARLCAHPDTACGDIDIVLPSERAMVARAGRGVARLRPSGRGLHQLFAAVARVHADAPAVIEDGLCLPYGQLDRKANRLAHALLAAGLPREQPVAVLCGRNVLLPEAALGIWKAGGAYLPIDPATPADRVAFMLADAGVTTVLACQPAPVPDGLRVLAPADWAAFPDGDPKRPASDSDLAYVIYTSGSTGHPKGVAIEHRGFINMILGQIELFGLVPDDRVLLFASPAFDASLSEMFMALLTGAALVPASRTLIDAPWDLRAMMSRHRVTVATLPPSYLRLFDRADLSGLRVLITAGEAPIEPDARHYAAHLAYFNAYGPTEVAVCATAGRVWPDQSGLIPIGAPLPNVGAFVLDRRLRPLPPGSAGELCLSGPGLARGYLNRPDLSAQQFVAAPWDGGETLYRTGDLVRLSLAGELLYLGRVDRQIKLRGQRIELGEIEAVLSSHPDLIQTAVVAEGHAGNGHYDGLAAFLVARPGHAVPSFSDLSTWLGARLPAVMVPRRMMPVDTLPTTRSGKIDRQRLALLPKDGSAVGAIRLPTTATELSLAALWTELLPSGEPVAADDNFFAKGGDSLQAIRLSHLLRERLGVDLPALALFSAPTLAGLAALIDRTGTSVPAEAGAAIDDGNWRDDAEPSHGQAQLYALDQTGAAGALYAMPVVVEIDGETDAGRWQAALAAVVARHDALRSAFAIDNGHLRRRVLPTVDVTLETADVSSGPDAWECAAAAVADAIHRPFLLDRAPLLRAGLLIYAEGRALFYLCLHHIVADGRSLEIILDEMAATLAGHAPTGQPFPFARRVAEERAYLASADAVGDGDWWQAKMRPPPPPLPFPTDFPRPPLRRNQGARVNRIVPAVIAKGLEDLAQRSRTSLFGLVSALVATLLHRVSGAEDLVVGLPATTRLRPEHADCVGYCVNTLPLRLRLRADQSFAEVLDIVRVALVEALAHAAWPLDLLAPDDGVARDPGRAALFDVVIVEEAARFGGRPAVDIPFRVARFDLAFLFCRCDDGTVRFSLDYDTDLFLPRTMALLLESLEALATEVIADPVARLAPSPRRSRDSGNPAGGMDPRCRGNDDRGAVGIAPSPTGGEGGLALAAVLFAWRAVLGRDDIGADDNFFAVGGDSIKAIQVCGRLRQAGWSASARALFEHPTPTSFARQLGRTDAAASRPPAVTEAPLLPIQRWLWCDHPDAVADFAMPLLVRLPEACDPDRLEAALRALVRHHGMLRARFDDGDDGLGRLHIGEIADIAWTIAPSLPGETTADTLGRIAPALHRWLSPRLGRHLGAALLRRDGEQLLYLVVHHLVVDGLSWRILLEDLAAVYVGGPSALSRPTASFLDWAEAIVGRDAVTERAYWQEVLQAPSWEAPAPRGVPAPGLERRVARLPETASRRLEQPYGDLRPAELRLAAVGMALGRLAGGGAACLVTLEGHGRDSSLAPLDVSRTVGWFTCAYPFALPSSPLARPLALAERVAKTLRAVPAGGVGYGVLAAREDSVRRHPAITVNDHGRIDGDGPFTPLSLVPPVAVDGKVPPGSPVTITLAADGDGLSVECLSRRDQVDGAWAERLLEAVVAALTEMAGAVEAPACRTLPLTPAQAGMLFHYLAEPGSMVHAQQISFRLRGHAAMETLARAWGLVAARHDSLKALFSNGADGPVQTIADKPPHVWTSADLSALSPAKRAAEVAALLAAEAAKPLDIVLGPTLRACLIRQGADDHLLVWSFHHILMDGWCIALLLSEIIKAHDALAEGRTPALPPPASLASYLAWLDGRDPAADRDYWRDVLAGVETPTSLAARLPEAAGGAATDVCSLSLSADQTQALTALAAGWGISLSALIQAAWGVLLVRRTGSRDVVFGLVTSGRDAEIEGIERLVGMLIRTVPVRLRLDDDDCGVLDLARRLHDEQARRLAHETLPLPEILALTPVGTALFDHILMVETYPTDLGGSELRVAEVTGTEHLPYDLGLSVLPGGQLGFRFTFNSQRYAPSFVRDLGESWLGLIEGLLDDPHGPALALPALSLDQRSHLTRWAEASRRDWAEARPLPFLFAACAARHPERTALIIPGGRRITYGALAGRVGELSEWLRRAGAGPQRPVAVCLERDADLVAVLLAVQCLGAAYVPLDPLYPPERLAYIVTDCGAQLLIAEAATAAILGDLQPPGLDILRIDALPWTGGRPMMPVPAPGDLAYVIYTSGSTGRPKGVEVTHAGLTNFLLSLTEQPGVAETDVLLAVTTVCFDIAGLELYGPLIRGGQVVLASREAASDGRRLASLIEAHDVSIMQATPTGWSLLLECGWRGRPGLKALVGGEALPVAVASALLERCAEVWNLYGPTETTIWSTRKRLFAGADDRPKITIGTPIANTSAYVLGADLELLAEGETGELCLGGAGVARGYHGRPDLTSERFRILPFAPFERVYRTGDVVRWSEAGDLLYVGRADHQIKLRGFRIEPGEIESRLTALPGIRQAVVGVGDFRGTGPELAAWIVGGGGIVDGELRRRLLESLPYYMIPSLFVRLPSMPVTPNGKIDRAALPPPADGDRDGLVSLPSPLSPKEPSADSLALVIGLWRRILNRTDISAGDDFFALGGHSLLAMRLAAGLEQAVGKSVALADLMTLCTPSAQARRLDEAGGQDLRPIPSGPDAPDYPISPLQARLWALFHLSPEVVAYAVPVLLETGGAGAIDLELLAEALAQAIGGHEILRSRFPLNNGEPRQQVLSGPPQIERFDLSSESDPRAAATRLVETMAARPFDPDLPPIRAAVIRLAPERFALALVLHHLLCDDWSLAVLARDIAAWVAHLSGQGPRPAAPKLRYRDHAVWLHERLRRGELVASRDWWLRQLAPPLTPMSLFPDHPRAPRRSYRGAVVRFTVEAERRQSLARLAVAQDTTEFAVLAALLAALLRRLSGQNDIRFGFPVAGRHRSELQDVVGLLVNTLVLRQSVAADMRFDRLLAATTAGLRKALEHADYPFDLLLADLRLPRDPSRTPIFDVMLVLQDDPPRQEENGGLTLTALPLSSPGAKFDLSFVFRPRSDGGLEAEIDYDAGLFDSLRIDALARSFLSLAGSALADPACPVAGLLLAADAGPPVPPPAKQHPLPAVRLTPSQAAVSPDLAGTEAALVILEGEPAGDGPARALHAVNPAIEVIEEVSVVPGQPGLSRRLPAGAARLFDSPGPETVILDAAGRQCPTFWPGELCRRSENAPLVRSGRLARRLADGRIELPDTVEQGDETVGLLLENDPRVARAMVVEGTAFVLPAVPCLEPESLLAALRECLPTLKVPPRVRLLDTLPLDGRGRWDRAALIGAASPMAPATARLEDAAVLSRLRQLFAQALGVDDCADDDHFFALGGDSLTALRLCAAIEAEFAVPCPVGSLFGAPTPLMIARRIEAGRDDDVPSEPDEGPLALSQEEAEFLRALAED